MQHNKQFQTLHTSCIFRVEQWVVCMLRTQAKISPNILYPCLSARCACKSSPSRNPDSIFLVPPVFLGYLPSWGLEFFKGRAAIVLMFWVFCFLTQQLQCPVVVWVPVLCCFGFHATCIVQMITGLVMCDNHCAIVYIFKVLLVLLFGSQICVLLRVCLVFIPVSVHGTL
jgi:hypothetical protein